MIKEIKFEYKKDTNEPLIFALSSIFQQKNYHIQCTVCGNIKLVFYNHL